MLNMATRQNTSQKADQMFLNGVRSGRIFDIETIVNRGLVRDVFYPDEPSVDEAYSKAKADIEEDNLR